MLVFWFICSIWWFYYGNASHITVTCKRNCNVTDKQISGGEGDDIALKYSVTTKDFGSVQITYSQLLIVTLWKSGALAINSKRPKFVRFNDTMSHSTYSGYYFSFEVIKLNQTWQDMQFSSTLTWTNGSAEQDHVTLNVLYEPKLVTRCKSTYEVKEHDDLNITFRLAGNPKPNVKAKIDNKYINFTSLDKDSPFVFAQNFKNISRSLCGKLLRIEVVGYKRLYAQPLALFSTIQVVFLPKVPTGLKVQNDGFCVGIQWHKIESGNCEVIYTLAYAFVVAGNKTRSNITSTNATSVSLCFPTSNTRYDVTLRVKSHVWNQTSEFSKPITVTLNPSAVRPGTKSSGTIIVSVIAGLVVLAVIITVAVLVSKGRLKLDCYRSTPEDNSSGTKTKGSHTIRIIHRNAVNNGMEGDYAEIGGVQNEAAIQSTDYAELGPGGRVEEREETVEPSTYAQVNTDKAYYPSLNPQTPKEKTEPDYAVVSKTPAF